MYKLKFLHLIKDQKFIDSAHEFFEAVAPGANTYILAGRSKPIKFLNGVNPVRVPRFAFYYPWFVKSLDAYDAVILHSLYPFSLEVLARINPRIPVWWIGMGYDYYDLIIEKRSDALKEKTKQIYGLLNSQNKRAARTFLRTPCYRLLYPNNHRKKELLKKVDIFSPVLTSEYLLLKNICSGSFPQYVAWNYGNVANLIDRRLESDTVNGKNILIGNSGNPTNNHLDTFELLLASEVSPDAKIIVPLSYGDAEYCEKIMAEGKRLFGEKFMPITEFMEMDKYIDLLSTCSTVIMNHLRQQGAGNLFIALFLGAKIFLDAQNPLFEELSEMGFTVKKLSDLNGERLNEPVTWEQLRANRVILKATRGRASYEKRTKDALAELTRLRSEKAR